MSSSQSEITNLPEKFERARQLQSQDDTSGAISEYRLILEIDPENLAALHQLAQLSEGQGDFAAAIEYYQKSVEIDAEPPFWVYRHLGFALSQQERLEEAVETYQRAIELNPEEAKTYSLLGQVRGKQGNFAGAIESYKKAIELSQELPIWVYLNLGEALSQEKRFEEAIVAYEKAIELDPENAGIRQLLDEATIQHELSRKTATDNGSEHFDRARELQSAGQLEEALSEYQKVLEGDSNYLAALHQIAQIYESQGKWEQAIEGYQKAIDLDANPPFWVYRHLGFALSQQERLDEAIEAYQRAIELNPEDTDVYCLLGQTLEKNGYIDRAIIAYKDSLELDPNCYWAYYCLGDSLASQNQWEEAVDAYRQAIKIQPDLPGLTQKLQTLLQKQNEILDAVSIKGESGDISKVKFTEVVPLMNRFFDEEWYFKTYPDVVSAIVMGSAKSAFEYYLRFGIPKHHSPNSSFDEEWYLAYNPDVKAAVNSGHLSSGFEHFLMTGRYEGRLAKPDLYSTLKQKYPSIIEPVGINNIEALEFKLKPLPARITETTSKINILVPTLDADIIFGGYISLLHLIRRLIEESFEVRLIVCEDRDCNIELFKLQLKSKKKISEAIEKCHIVNVTNKNKVIDISIDDRFIAYDAWTAILAHHLSCLTNFKKYFFFIQEYETIFYHNCSIAAIIDSAYRLPHIALFNTQILADFFEKQGLGAFLDKGDCNYIVFEHSLGKLSPPTLAEMQAKSGKSLLFYARPEAHAARNLFEIGILGLRQAVDRNVFNNSWTFHGIGTLGSSYNLSLGQNLEINIFSKIPQNEYEKVLRSYDIGLSLMYAPHPSILPFEMAKAGLTVVTNVYQNRDSKKLSAITGNIIPCYPDINSIANALEIAVKQAADFQFRIDNATIDWVDDWDLTFGQEFFERLKLFLW